MLKSISLWTIFRNILWKNDKVIFYISHGSSIKTSLKWFINNYPKATLKNKRWVKWDLIVKNSPRSHQQNLFRGVFFFSPYLFQPLISLTLLIYLFIHGFKMRKISLDHFGRIYYYYLISPFLLWRLMA